MLNKLPEAPIFLHVIAYLRFAPCKARHKNRWRFVVLSKPKSPAYWSLSSGSCAEKSLARPLRADESEPNILKIANHMCFTTYTAGSGNSRNAILCIFAKTSNQFSTLQLSNYTTLIVSLTQKSAGVLLAGSLITLALATTPNAHRTRPSRKQAGPCQREEKIELAKKIFVAHYNNMNLASFDP